MKTVIALLFATAVVQAKGGITLDCSDEAPGIGGHCIENEDCFNGSKCAYVSFNVKVEEMKKNLKETERLTKSVMNSFCLSNETI